MKVGILGGTFDPVHRGHLDVALAAHAAFGLDRVLLMPSRVPPHRTGPHASAAHRFAMTALAAMPYPPFLLSDLEMESDAPSYTVATLDRLAARGMNTAELFFLTGADAFRDIRTWKDFPALLDRCHFVAVARPGQKASALPALLPELAERMRPAPCPVPDRPSVLLLDADTAPVSATDIRRRVASGLDISGLVPAPVAEYIAKHQLYSLVPPKGQA